MKTPKYLSILSLAVIGAVYGASPALADPILGSDLASFAILGGGGVTIGGTGSVINGSIGAFPTTSITGVIPTNFNISGGTVQSGGPTASSAQGQLTTAITALSGMTPTGGTVTSLGGLTLGPGVYSSSSTMDLTGILTLDGGGNANALWVFLVGSALNTASNSVVNVTSTGAGAGVYWVLPTTSGSATLGKDSVFAGNILANISITADTNVTDSCGRLLTQTASVTLAGTDTIGIGCTGILAGSNGLSGGGTITSGAVNTLPSAPVPEPETYAMLLAGLGLIGFTARRRKNLAV